MNKFNWLIMQTLLILELGFQNDIVAKCDEDYEEEIRERDDIRADIDGQNSYPRKDN